MEHSRLDLTWERSLGHSQISPKGISSLSSSEGASPRLRSPFSGLLLSLKYDPVEVLDLVDRIWPEWVFGRPGSGRKSKDPLPIVCYLLPLCDAEYGVVFNLREAYRRLEGDREYRSQCGYADSLPSESVFRKVAAEMCKSWKGFQTCVLSPEALEALLARIGTDPFGHPGDSTVGEGSPLFEAELPGVGVGMAIFLLASFMGITGPVRFLELLGSREAGLASRPWVPTGWMAQLPPSTPLVRSHTAVTGNSITALRLMR